MFSGGEDTWLYGFRGRAVSLAWWGGQDVYAQPELDQGGLRNPDGWGFAAFGRVIEGMEVVRRIQARETDGQYFAEGSRVMIQGMRRGG